jgi:hypothetical protein
LDALREPENNGDMHISLLLEHPDIYSIDVRVVNHFIRAFYEILWDKNSEGHKKLSLKILDGVHEESAFIEIRNEQMCIVEHMSPVMESECKDDESTYFINHLDAVAIRRAQLAQFFSDKIAKNHGDATTERMS